MLKQSCMKKIIYCNPPFDTSSRSLQQCYSSRHKFSQHSLPTQFHESKPAMSLNEIYLVFEWTGPHDLIPHEICLPPPNHPPHPPYQLEGTNSAMLSLMLSWNVKLGWFFTWLYIEKNYNRKIWLVWETS